MNPKQPSDWKSGPGERGRKLFLAGAHFEAHEAWEEGWTKLSLPWRSEVKAWIQVCGVLVHAKKGNIDPAQRLAERALVWLSDAAAHRRLQKVEPIATERTLKDLEERLLRLLAAWQSGSPDAAVELKNLADVRPIFGSEKETQWLT